MNPGLLRDKVKFYRLQTVSDGAGGYPATFVLAFETLGKLTPMRARMEEVAGRQVIIQPYKLVIRYYPNKIPESGMQVEYRRGKYLIAEVNETDPHFKFIDMMVTRIKPATNEDQN